MRWPESTWTHKPPCGTQPRYDGSLAVGLVNLVPFLDVSGEAVSRDLRTHSPLATTNPVDVMHGPLGPMRGQRDNLTNEDHVVNQTFCIDAAPFTIALWWMMPAVGAGQRGLMCLESNPANGFPRILLTIDRTSGQLHYLCNGGTYVAGTASYPVKKVNCTVITWREGNWYAYLNGILDITPFGANNDSGNKTHFFVNNGFANCPQFGALQAASWLRALTPTEIVALNDPFTLLQPPGSALLRLVKAPSGALTAAQEIGIFDQQLAGAMVGLTYQ